MWKFGRARNAVGTQSDKRPQLLRIFPNFHSCFYLTIRLWARDFYEVIVDEVEIRQAWFRWMAQCMGYLLVACKGPPVKSRVQGRVSCTDASPQLDLLIWMPNSFVFDCVCWVVWVCLNLLCWHGVLLERSLSRACVGGILLARGGGGGQNTPGHWPCQLRACFCEYGQIYIEIFKRFCRKGKKVKTPILEPLMNTLLSFS